MSGWLRQVAAWFDSSAAVTATTGSRPDEAAGDPRAGRRIDWLRVVPFVAIHLGCLGVLWVGVNATALVVLAASYGLRMFAITAFYHRYFSHQAFRAGRLTQFLFAVLGASAAQRGPLWWASHHRHHHLHADQEADAHSAARHGFLWSHVGWFMARENYATRTALVPTLARYPELRWLDRFDALVPSCLLAALYFAGEFVADRWPALETSGAQWVVWGFFVATVALYHATFTINSLAHRLGSRRYSTRDDSRNNGWLALLTFGEGWHNNHHHYPASARQGFFWWEFDPTWYALRLLAAIGLIRDVRTVPLAIRDRRRSAAASSADELP